VGYVIAAVLVVLIVGGIVMLVVMNSTRRSNVSDSGTPLGDTGQHAGEQTEAGETVGGQDADTHGGTGEPQTGYTGTGEAGSDHAPDDENVARPVVGGEAEGERRVD
jgi:hypothetical protein